MWRRQETQIERLRAAIGEDPAEARARIEQALEDPAYRRSDRVRLWGLMAAACTTLGEFPNAERALEQGRRIRTRDVAASAELQAQKAQYLGVVGRFEEASEVSARAVELARSVAEMPAGKSSASRRRYNRRRFTLAGSLVVAGDIASRQGRRADAFRDVLEALSVGDPESAAWRAAVTLLGRLIAAGGGTHEDLRASLEIIHAALAVRIPRLHTVKLHWTRALILARVGLHRWAEAIMCNVVKELESMGAMGDFGHALHHLVWIVAERAAQPDRAQYLLLRMGGALDDDTRDRIAARIGAARPPATIPPRFLGW